MKSCPVCLEKYTKKLRKNIQCTHCDFVSCKSCLQTYMLSQFQDPHCMKCKHEYSRDFVDSFCTRKFRNVDYKKHREKILYDREMAKMPETQPYVNRELEIRKLREEYIDLVTTGVHGNRERLVEILDAVNVLKNTSISKEEVFTHKCPTMDCRGFLSPSWECAICNKTFCQNCLEETNEGHTCNEELVKTIKLLKRDTRPCPKCGVHIHKLSGCSQMWCTQCQTTFDWSTGIIETGRVHNPHYFEFKKRSRELSDIPCGGRPSLQELVDKGASQTIIDIFKILERNDSLILYRYDNNWDADNRFLRMGYLLNYISGDELKIEVQQREKLREKYRETRDLYQMFNDTVGDLLRQYVVNSIDIVDDVKKLIEYSNTVIIRIRYRYNSLIPNNIILLDTR